MAGIYVHIPYCRQACHYCNFHFSTKRENTAQMVRALLREADLRLPEWAGHRWDSLYLGGGTPSVLPPAELQALLAGLAERFALAADAEITLEANPDDLSPERLAALRDSPVNRLSIGIQSFREEDLRWMNRAHDAGQALRCLDLAAAAGFEQFNADLIYGLPGLSDEAWRDNLRRVFGFGVSHLSAYALTVEEGTALAHFVRTGRVAAPPDARAAAHFDLMQEEAAPGRLRALRDQQPLPGSGLCPAQHGLLDRGALPGSGAFGAQL
jgi:coproporphyrinogen III oxidase-like Fe-S oxidoreductase